MAQNSLSMIDLSIDSYVSGNEIRMQVRSAQRVNWCATWRLCSLPIRSRS
jgi:hypothetical protein